MYVGFSFQLPTVLQRSRQYQHHVTVLGEGTIQTHLGTTVATLVHSGTEGIGARVVGVGMDR